MIVHFMQLKILLIELKKIEIMFLIVRNTVHDKDSQSFEKASKSVQVLMFFGREHHKEAPAKLKAFCPKQVLEEGRLSWQVEEERVL